MEDWDFIKLQAEKFKESETELTSFIKKNRYKVRSVEGNYIYFERVEGGKDFSLSKTIVDSAISKLKIKLRIKTGQLMKGSIAREVAFCEFHPSISWDSETRELVFDRNNYFSEKSDSIDEASNDDFEKELRTIRKRRYQSKFRQNLLKIYRNKCCISGSDIELVLEAAHISKHSKSGINESTNGLLLRSDLHILFDERMLVIHPIKLTIHFHPDLKKSEYSIYEGKKIRNRIDKKSPDANCLEERWQSVDWTK